MSPMWDIIADNGCFSGKWTEYDWLTWLEALSKQVPIRFAVAPDVFDQSGEECHWPTVEFWEKSEKSNESRAEEIRDRVKEANREAKILRDNGIDRKGKKVPAKYKPVSFETFKSRLDTYTTYTVVELNPAEQSEESV